MASVQVNGKSVDISGVLPLRMGDWKRLEAAGITPDAFSKGLSIIHATQFVLYVLRKGNEAVTESDIDDLTTDQFRVIAEQITALESGAHADVPFSTSNISSPEPMAGASTKS